MSESQTGETAGEVLMIIKKPVPVTELARLANLLTEIHGAGKLVIRPSGRNWLEFERESAAKE